MHKPTLYRMVLINEGPLPSVQKARLMERQPHLLEAKRVFSPSAVSNLSWVINSLENLMRAVDHLPDICTHIRMQTRFSMQFPGFMAVAGLPKSRV